jgi:hypothetical protein
VIEQLGRERYEEIIKTLSITQREALRTFEPTTHRGFKRVGTARGLLAAGLLDEEETLTDLGWQVRAACHVEPGSFTSQVTQVLLDSGFAWSLLPAHGAASGELFHVRSDSSFGGVWVFFRTAGRANAAGRVLRSVDLKVQQPKETSLHVEDPERPLGKGIETLRTDLGGN